MAEVRGSRCVASTLFALLLLQTFGCPTDPVVEGPDGEPMLPPMSGNGDRAAHPQPGQSGPGGPGAPPPGGAPGQELQGALPGDNVPGVDSFADPSKTDLSRAEGERASPDASSVPGVPPAGKPTDGSDTSARPASPGSFTGGAEGEVFVARPAAPGTHPEWSGASSSRPAVPPASDSPPGKMYVRLDLLPDQLRTQDEVESSGNAVRVSGTLVGEVCEGKEIRIDAMAREDDRPELVTVKRMKGVGAFEVFIPKGDQEVWLTVFCDVNGDKAFEEGTDYLGAYADNPLRTDADVSGIAIELSREVPQPGEGMPSEQP